MSRPSAAWLCLLCALLLPAGRHLSAASSKASGPLTVASTVAAENEVAFRLGDAAKPFGSSTVVGDFNTDGKADVAVADHIARHAGGYAYRLEFSVSGLEPHDVTFESTRDAITLSVADVDRDNDLDVVVGVALSGETVGVWLNDGHGHFTAGAMPKAPATVTPVQSFGLRDLVVQFGAFESSPRRDEEVIPPTPRAPLTDSTSRSIQSPSIVLRPALTLNRTHSRAPPAVRLGVRS